MTIEKYFILNEQGQEDGPYTPEQVFDQFRDGRINAGTLTRLASGTDWNIAGSIPIIAQFGSTENLKSFADHVDRYTPFAKFVGGVLGVSAFAFLVGGGSYALYWLFTVWVE